MSDDSGTVEDTDKGLLAEVTDDSCTVEFSDIFPLERASDDFQKSVFVDPVVDIKPEDLHGVKQEPADEYDNGDLNYSVKQEPAHEYEMEAPSFTVQVSSTCSY